MIPILFTYMLYVKKQKQKLITLNSLSSNQLNYNSKCLIIILSTFDDFKNISHSNVTVH